MDGAEARASHAGPDIPPGHDYFADEAAQPSLVSQFESLRTNRDMVAERARYLDAKPDKTLALVAEMEMGEPELPPGAVVTYVCPMHPEVVSNEQGSARSAA